MESKSLKTHIVRDEIVVLRDGVSTAHHIVNVYDVTCATMRDYIKAIFEGGKENSAVCALIAKAINAPSVHDLDDACATAAAFTSWSITTPEEDVVNVEVQTTLPRFVWEGTDMGACPEEADIKRFESRLAHHERCHGSMGEEVAMFLHRFNVECNALGVPKGSSLAREIRETIIRLGHAADANLDEKCGHGLTQGASVGDDGGDTKSDEEDEETDNEDDTRKPTVPVRVDFEK